MCRMLQKNLKQFKCEVISKGFNRWNVMIELKPCPFCGSSAHINSDGENDKYGFYTSCDDCYCVIGEPEIYFDEDVKYGDEIGMRKMLILSMNKLNELNS